MIPAQGDASASGARGRAAAASSAPPAAPATAAAPPASSSAAGASVYFESGSATLDATARGMLAKLAGELAGGTKRVAISGYTDRHGDYAANVDLAKRRAQAVRDALAAGGVPDARLQMRPPQNVVGDGTEALARRVDLSLAD